MNGKLREGYTTGTCAQAATKAAMQVLLGVQSVQEMRTVAVTLPKGRRLELKIEDVRITMKEDAKTLAAVACAVRKDSGDDPDITNGVWVYSRVEKTADGQIVIDGGDGIGRVTRPGLEQPVGAAAINRVPRQMIRREVEALCEETDYRDGIRVEISIPGGALLAKKTFNPKLGVEGGLSVLGTSGIVEPMSEQAILDTIRLDISVKLARRTDGWLVMTPGNYGLEFIQEEYGIAEPEIVKCSNYIGQSIDMAREAGCRSLLLVGHIGKLVKVAGGIMNTHSRVADARMEILAAAALEVGIPGEKAVKFLNCITADDALSLCDKQERMRLMGGVMRRMGRYLTNRAGAEMQIEAVTFSKVYGILGKTEYADLLAHHALAVENI